MKKLIGLIFLLVIFVSGCSSKAEKGFEGEWFNVDAQEEWATVKNNTLYFPIGKSIKYEVNESDDNSLDVTTFMETNGQEFEVDYEIDFTQKDFTHAVVFAEQYSDDGYLVNKNSFVIKKDKEEGTFIKFVKMIFSVIVVILFIGFLFWIFGNPKIRKMLGLDK